MKYWRQQNFALMGPFLAILGLNLSALYSATVYGQAGEALKQAIYMVLGLVLVLGLSLIDYSRLVKFRVPLYFVTLGSLLAVFAVGHSVNGAQRWLSLGPMGTFQPSELAKLTTVVVAASLLSAPVTLKRTFLTSLVIAPLFLTILIQPDLGTSLVLIAIGAVMAFVSGTNGTLLFALFGLGSSLLPYVLKEYQKDRLMVFVNPDIDPKGMGYQLVQSQTAIGSGGFFGKSLLKGHMTQHGFVPENWTDFIFTVIGEELGFVGGCGLLLLYALLFFAILNVAAKARDRLGSLLCVGVATLLLFQVFVNIGMTIGLAPVVGIPLPFASYGGTAMVVYSTGIGLVASVWRHSQVREEKLSDRPHPSMEMPSPIC